MNWLDQAEAIDKNRSQNEGVKEAKRLHIHNQWIASDFESDRTKGRRSRRRSPPN